VGAADVGAGVAALFSEGCSGTGLFSAFVVSDCGVDEDSAGERAAGASGASPAAGSWLGVAAESVEGTELDWDAGGWPEFINLSKRKAKGNGDRSGDAE